MYVTSMRSGPQDVSLDLQASSITYKCPRHLYVMMNAKGSPTSQQGTG
jgi:hypothetical protein